MDNLGFVEGFSNLKLTKGRRLSRTHSVDVDNSAITAETNR